MRAQKIYTAFLLAALSIVEDIGGYIEMREGQNSIHITNSTISRISHAFTESGLG